MNASVASRLLKSLGVAAALAACTTTQAVPLGRFDANKGVVGFNKWCPSEARLRYEAAAIAAFGALSPDVRHLSLARLNAVLDQIHTGAEAAGLSASASLAGQEALLVQLDSGSTVLRRYALLLGNDAAPITDDLGLAEQVRELGPARRVANETIHAGLCELDRQAAHDLNRLLRQAGPPPTHPTVVEAVFSVANHAPDASLVDLVLRRYEEVELPLSLRSRRALLVDRARAARGERQIYGTKFVCENGSATPYPIETAAADLNALRESVGLPSMEAYAQLMARMCVP